MKLKTFILTFLMMSCSIVFGQTAYEAGSEAMLRARLNRDCTIKITDDFSIETTVDIPNGREITIDLNGHKLSTKDNSTYIFNNQGLLTIKDSDPEGKGTISACGIYNGKTFTRTAILDVNYEALLTIESGVFNNISSDGGAAIENYGVLDIFGGEFYGEYSAITNYGVATIKNAYIECLNRDNGNGPAAIRNDFEMIFGEGVEIVGRYTKITETGKYTGEPTYLFAELNGTKYPSLQAALDACNTGNNTINLLFHNSDNATVSQEEGINITIVGNGYKNKQFEYTGTIYVNGNSRSTGAETLTIQDVDFYTEKDTHDFISCNDGGNSVIRYAHNVTVQDCNFTATEGSTAVVALRFRQSYNINVVNSEFTNLHSAMWATGTSGIAFDNIKATKCKEGGISAGTSTPVNVKNSIIEGAKYGVRADGSGDYRLTVESSELTAEVPVIVRNTTGEYNLTVKEDATLASTNNGPQVVVTAGKDNEAYVTPTSDVNVTLDNVTSTFGLTAKIGNAFYATLQDAIDNAIDGDEIVLVSDVTEDVTVTQKADLDLIIAGAGKKFTGVMTVFGDARHDGNETLTIKDINFVAKNGSDACILSPDRTAQNPARYSYSHNVTVENCSFTDVDGNVNCAAIRHNDGGDVNWTLNKCTVDNTMHSLIQTNNVNGKLVIAECTVNSKNGVNLNSCTNVEMTGCNFDVQGYALRSGVGSGGNLGVAKTYVLENNTLKSACDDGDAVIMFRASSVDANFSMEKNVVSGATHISGNTAATKIAADENYWDGKEAPVVAEGSAPIVVNSYYSDDALTNLVRNEMGSIYAFVSSDRIFGDVTTNAKESIKIEIIGKDGNLIGTSSLENLSYATGFNKQLTWRINLGDDDSDSWAMTWEEGCPSINNMPTKVKLYVDAKEGDAAVAEAEIKYTANGDGQSPVFAAKTNANGKINSFIACEGKFNLNEANTFLANALTAGDNVAITVAGTYAVPTGKNLTITGAVDGVKFNMASPVGIHSSMTFNNVTFEYGNANYVGLQHAGTMVYNNCIINGQVFLYGTSETFNNCTFNQNSSDAYNVWTYGAKEVAFNECTFNSAGKSVLVYNEGACATDLTVTDTKFIATATVDDKAAIEIDCSLMPKGTSIVIDGVEEGKTTATGFGANTKSGSSLWNDKKVVEGAPNGGTSSEVIIDDVVVKEPALMNLAGGGTEENPYLISNLEDLIWFRYQVNAGVNNYADKHVKLAADIDLNNEEWTPIGNVTYDSKYKPADADASKVFSGVFNGNGKVISNLKVASTVGGVDTQANVGLFGITGEGAVIKDLTLTNVNIETDGRNVGALAGFAYKAALSNITVNGNIQIKGGNNVAGVAGMTRYYDMSATDISVSGANGSAIIGNNIVGGIFAEIAPNGSEQTFKNLSVENVAITGASGVGGIVGLLTLGTVENVSVKNVALTGNTLYNEIPMGRIRLGSVAGLMGGEYATIANVTTENVTAKNLVGDAVVLPIIGANYGSASNATEAKIGDTYYATLQTAINNVKNGETITLLADCAEAITFTQTKDVSFVLDGNDKTYTGSINITARAGLDATSTLVIKNFNFKTDKTSYDFIKSVETNYYPNNITITGCSFEGTSDINTEGYAVVAVRMKSANNLVIKDCTGTGLHSFLQNTAGWNLTIDNVKVNNAAEGGLALGTVQGVTVKNCEFNSGRYGIRLDGQLNNNAVIESNKINAFIPVVVRKASHDGTITFNGTNEFTQSNTDGYWCVIGTEEYKTDGALPSAATAKINVTLSDAGLDRNGIYGNYGVAKINNAVYNTFADALNAVNDGETITVLDVEGSEVSTEIEFTKDIEFTITGEAPNYALPVVTFQNATVNISNAKILIPELDARQNATINVINSTVYDAGGNSIAKSYYNGAINISGTSEVYMMQVTTMGYINISGTAKLHATWQTNVYGNGLVTIKDNATFNTAALHLTGQDYSGRDNTDTERVGKPAEIVVDGANLTVGKVLSSNNADYSYNSSKGINVGTVDGKSAILNIMNGGKVNIYMANGETTNFGAGATVNVDASTLNTICRSAEGTVTLANNGTMNVTGTASINIKNLTGKAINFTDVTIADAYIGGGVNAFGTNNFTGETNVTGIFSVGYYNASAAPVVVNVTGNFNGGNVLIGSSNEHVLNLGNAESDRTTAHFATQLGAFGDVNINNADVTYQYAFIRNDFNVTNSTMVITGGYNTYFSGNAKVVLDKTTWNLPGFANIGSYGGGMYGNADITLKNGSVMSGTKLGIEVSGDYEVKVTIEDNSRLEATELTNQGSIVLADVEAKVTSNEFDNVPTTSVAYHKVNYVEGSYVVVAKDYVAQIYDVNNNTNDDRRYETLAEAATAAQDGETIQLLWNEGDAPISMNASLYGKDVTITGTATVDWSKGFLFVGRGGEGDATLTFDNANLTSASNQASTGIHVSGREKNTDNKYDGTVIIKNSTIELDYLINKGTMTLDESTLTVKNGFSIGGRPASETESGQDATATITLNNGSKVVVNNHNGMGLGYEAIGVMNINSGSTFETTQSFLVTAKGTMNVNGGNVKVAGTLTNNGTVYVTGEANLDATVTGDGWFYMNGVTLDADTKLIGAKVGFINGENNIVASTIKDGWFSVGIGKNTDAETAAAFATANGITLGSVTVNVSDNATVYTSTDAAYSGWVGSAYSAADKGVNKYILNINNSLARFGYMHVSKDGEMNVTGQTNNKYEYAGNAVDFYAGTFINNGNVTLNGVDAWAQHTKISVDHADAVLNITNGTKYEANCTTGNVNDNTFLYYNAGTVNIDETSSVNIEKATKLVEGAVLNIASNKVIAKGAFTGNGKINFTSETATLTVPTTGLTVNNETGNNDIKVVYENGTYKFIDKHYVAEIDGGAKYETLAEAIEAVAENGTVKLIDHEIFTEDNRTNSSGTWYEGVYYVGDKNFTIDLNNYTVTQNGAVNDYMFLFKNDGAKDNTITLKNGTIDAGTDAYCAICTSTTSTKQITINTENINFVGNNSGGAVLKIRGGAELNVKAGTEITGENSYVGIECYGATVNIYDGAEIYQNGTTSYNGSLVGASGNGTVNVYGGKGTSAKGGFIAMTSGGTINVSGGEWTANTNGATANDNNAVLIAQSADGASSIVNVTGGIFRGGYNCYGDAAGDAQINISGGIFSVNPSDYCADNYGAVELPDGTWFVRMLAGTQTREFANAGWYWFSTYIQNMEGQPGLTTLKSELDGKGKEIKSQHGGTRYYPAYDSWTSALTSLSTAEMYMINTTDAVTIDLTGAFVEYETREIELKEGWNWIGYPVSQELDINVALKNLQAKDGDYIKGKNNGEDAWFDEGYGWYPSFNFKPGHGYMYHSQQATSFTFNAVGGEDVNTDVRRSVANNYHWNANATQYPNNMTMVAVVDGIDDNEYEVAAFVNGEVRGSARPAYFEPLDTYILVLTIHGDDVEEMTFKYYDLSTNTEYDLNNKINYSNDAIVGSIYEPYMLTRGTTGIGEAAISNVNIYPNPTTTGTEINLEATCDKVEVFNALGVKVIEYHNVDTIDALETAGIYVIRITNNGNVQNCRLVVK